MPLAHHILAIQLLDVIAHADVLDVVDDRVLLDPLDERIAGPVVRDGQSQGVLRLNDLDLLGPALAMGEDEVVQADLAAQQPGHVHLVRVEGAEEDVLLGDVEALGDLLVQLTDAGEVVDEAGGTAVCQLAVEDQRWLRLLWHTVVVVVIVGDVIPLTGSLGVHGGATAKLASIRGGSLLVVVFSREERHDSSDGGRQGRLVVGHVATVVGFNRRQLPCS